MSRLLRLAAATGAVVTPLIAYHGVASAHSNNSSATCNGVHALAQYYELDDTNHITVTVGGSVVADVADFGTTYDQTFAVPQGGASTAWSVVIDSSDDTWDYTASGAVGPCGTATTTTTELVTTTTAQETTTSTSTSTTEIATTTTATSTTTSTPTSTTPTTTTLPSTTSSSVATTSTSSPAGSTTTVAPTPSTSPPAPSSTVPECSDSPNTPTDDCAPVCQPVTLPDGTNSCGPSLPATGSNTAEIVSVAWIAILAGIIVLGYGAAHRGHR